MSTGRFYPAIAMAIPAITMPRFRRSACGDFRDHDDATRARGGSRCRRGIFISRADVEGRAARDSRKAHSKTAAKAQVGPLARAAARVLTPMWEAFSLMGSCALGLRGSTLMVPFSTRHG
jgi:hypothetical protein